MKSFTNSLRRADDEIVTGWEPSELQGLNLKDNDFDLEEEKIRLLELFSKQDENQHNTKINRILSGVKVKPWRPCSLEDVLAAEMDVDEENEELQKPSPPVIKNWQPSEFISFLPGNEKHMEQIGNLPELSGYQPEGFPSFEKQDDENQANQAIEDFDDDVELEDEESEEELTSEEINALKEEIIQNAQLEAQELSAQMLSETQRQTEELIQLTSAEAEAVRIQMDGESQQLWIQANAELEVIKEQAHQEGYDEGHSSGYSEIQTAIQASKEVLEQFGSWRAQMLEQSEDAVIDMVKDIARVIFTDGVELDQDTLHQNFNRVLSEARTLGDLRVYVNPEDMIHLDSSWKDYQVQITGQNIKIYPTEAIRRGGCYVEGQQGSIDARVENQLTAILDSLSAVEEEQEVDEQNVEAEKDTQLTWL